MSRYEEEHGRIVIPAAEWPKFKQKLRETHNTEQVLCLRLATDLHTKLVASGKGKRNFDFRRALQALIDSEADRTSRGNRDRVWNLQYKLISPEGKPRRPLQKDFPMANGTTRQFSAGEGHLRLSTDKERTVDWDVPENNHACEYARESAMGKAFFTAIDRMNWTRGSGGTIVGNDEYNRDSEYEGGGANYRKEQYGPQYKSKVRAPARSYGFGMGMYR